MSDSPKVTDLNSEMIRLHELLAESQRDNAQLRAEKQRLFDLVRQQRMELHESGLISDKEYADLAMAKGSVERLETYDELRSELADLNEWKKGMKGIEDHYRVKEQLNNTKEELAKAQARVLDLESNNRYQRGYDAGEKSMREQVKAKCAPLVEALRAVKPIVIAVTDTHEWNIIVKNALEHAERSGLA